MTAGPTKRDIRAYEEAYASDYDFELVQVRYRRDAVLASLRAAEPRSVIEIGCGLEPLFPHYLRAGGTGVERWIVVEPADDFAQAAALLAESLPAMSVRQGFFEDVAAEITGSTGRVDMVICSGLLHEVPDQMALLRAIRNAMRPGAVLHVNVPSATSLHRRLAQAMGLIDELHDASARNRLLQQYRVYDLASLRADLVAAGLRPVADGGIFLKPFTHSQMQRVLQVLDVDVLPGLAALGARFPELASEIYVEAVSDGE